MPPLVLSDGEVQQLQGIASSRSLPHSNVQRAQIVLACGGGETNTSIAERIGLSGMTVGLYLNPPDKAMGRCVDEKTQIQALDRTQPLLPMGLDDAEGVTHDDIRHGTTTLFAALDVTRGEVLTQCRLRHRDQEFLGFLRQIENSVPQDLDVHLIADNDCTHKHAKVRTWLAQGPRFHVHYSPTDASWL